jgi:serine/threonine-protein kinase
VDARCDLFAVGAVLFRMATGASPFQRGSVTATLSALANFDPPAPETLPAPLARFVRRLLARDPAHRPADARAALAELDEAAREFRGRSLWRLAPVAGLAVLVAAALPAIVVTVRDRTGRPVEVLRVPPGGSVTVTETPPATQPGTAKAEPTRKDRTVGAGVRVRVTRNTLGYTDSTTDTLSQILSAGTRGTVLEVSADTNRCRIRAEQDKPPVWVSLDLVEIE